MLSSLATEPLNRFLVQLVLDELALPLGVDPNVVMAPGESDDEVEAETSDTEEKAGDVPRCVLGAEGKRANCTEATWHQRMLPVLTAQSTGTDLSFQHSTR